MYFEWFAFITVLALVLSLLGSKQGSFSLAFVGAILLMFVGTSIIFEGVQEKTNPQIDTNSDNSYKVTYEVATTNGSNSLSIYLLGWIFTIIGLTSSLMAVYNYIYLPKQQQRSDEI